MPEGKTVFFRKNASFKRDNRYNIFSCFAAMMRTANIGITNQSGNTEGTNTTDKTIMVQKKVLWNFYGLVLIAFA